jgi:hypothetical protein
VKQSFLVIFIILWSKGQRFLFNALDIWILLALHIIHASNNSNTFAQLNIQLHILYVKYLTNKTWPWGQYASLRTDWSDWGRYIARKAMFYWLYYTESKSFHPFCCCHVHYNLLSNNNLFVQCVKYLKPWSDLLLLLFSSDAAKNKVMLFFCYSFWLIKSNRQKNPALWDFHKLYK